MILPIQVCTTGVNILPTEAVINNERGVTDVSGLVGKSTSGSKIPCDKNTSFAMFDNACALHTFLLNFPNRKTE